MKLLNRVYIRNWHKVKYAMIPFERLNFLTGKNTAGKSTVIDALQFIFLGDKRGHYFNRAANDKAVRTLKGYLFAQNGYSDELGGFTYDREGQSFNTYLLAEFLNQTTGTFFTIGAVFDCDKHMDFDMRYICFEDRIPDHEFVREGKTMGIDAVKTFVYNQLSPGSVGELTPSEEKYQSNVRKLFGNIKPGFFKLFRQSVPFSPIMNIKQFISSFISDVQEKVEVEHLRDNIREYKLLERELRRVKLQIEKLEEIEEKYKVYLGWAKQERTEQYVIDRASVEQVRDQIQSTLLKIADGRDFVSHRMKHQEDLQKQTKAVEGEYHRLIEANADKVSVWKQLESALELAKAGERKSIEAERRVHDLIERPLFVWSSLLDQIEEDGELVDNALKMRQELQVWSDRIQQKPWAISYEQLRFLSDTMSELLDELRSKLHQLRSEERALLDEEQSVTNRLRDLERGLPAYDNPQIHLLQEAIRNGLLVKYKKEIEVLIVCELLDIRDEYWKNAIEGYLNQQRFYLIVDPKYYNDALEIYEALRLEKQIYSVGLVDIEKIIKLQPRVRAGSLAEEIITEHPYGRAYADFLLGDVMKVEHVTDLRNHLKSITASCLLYQGYVARPLHPKSYKTPYIGRKSTEVRIKQCKEQLAFLSEELTAKQARSSILNTWVKREAISASDISALLGREDEPGYVWEANQRQSRHILVIEKEQELARLDMTAILYYQNTRKSLEENLADLRSKETKNAEEIGAKNKEIEQLEKDILSLEEIEKEHRGNINEKYNVSWVKEIGQEAYEQGLAVYKQPIRLITKYGQMLENTKQEKDKCYGIVVECREEFIKANIGSSLSVRDIDNKQWVRELDELKKSELTNYEEKIASAKERAQVQFQEDFISKLKSNIETINEHIIDLNAALQYASFGRNTYEFVVKASPKYKAYYDMIMDDMLMEGYTLFSSDFETRHGETRDNLFQQILDTGEEGHSPEQIKQLEENLALFTDCRTYLDFDLLEHSDGRSSPLSKDIASKSGGETQTPFYIAVLASFMQLYRVKSSANSNTPRLVIFDEAFSKMDHQRIQQSLKLVKDMGLQLIISAPTEKINDISRIVDRTQVVMRVNDQVLVRPFDPKIIDDEESE